MVLAVETLNETIQMYELLEARYLRIFGTKRISDNDLLKFETEKKTSLMYFSDVEN